MITAGDYNSFKVVEDEALGKTFELIGPLQEKKINFSPLGGTSLPHPPSPSLCLILGPRRS